MLQKLGFACKDLVDCFDGGPQLEAATDTIPLVKSTFRAGLGEPLPESHSGDGARRGFVSHLDSDGEFRAVDAEYSTDARGRVRLPRSVVESSEISSCRLPPSAFTIVSGRDVPQISTCTKRLTRSTGSRTGAVNGLVFFTAEPSTTWRGS